MNGPRPFDAVPVDLRDRPAWMKGIVLGIPGIIFEDEGTGERLRLMPDGSLQPVLPGGYREARR